MLYGAYEAEISKDADPGFRFSGDEPARRSAFVR